jgi:sugar-specific transcriptional regulator TrmB
MSEEDSIARLKTLGLNLYESRAYLSLLNAKQLTAKGVGQSALIPQSRTYDVLESLTRKGFAMATPSSPPSYVPVHPEKVLGSYYGSERKKIQEHATSIQEEAQTKLEALREAYLAITKDFPATPESKGPVWDRVWVLQKRENIENTLVGLIKGAESEVLRITRPPVVKSNEPLDPFYIVGLENQRFVFDALERKVKMKWLSLEREIPTYLGLDVGEPPERRYLTRDEDITEKFLLVDSHSVLLNLHDPMSPAYGYVALAMQSKAVSSIFRDHFEKMWRRGGR